MGFRSAGDGRDCDFDPEEDVVTGTQTRVETIATVILPTGAVARAVDSYVETLGFERHAAMTSGDQYRRLRWRPPRCDAGYIAWMPTRYWPWPDLRQVSDARVTPEPPMAGQHQPNVEAEPPPFAMGELTARPCPAVTDS
jgi:hypothetical protein